MSISLSEQKKRDIDHLLDLIRRRVGDFQHGKLGSRFSVEGFQFEVLVAKRNTVYRISRNDIWYAKIPSHEGPARALREKLGADVMTRVGQDIKSCFPIGDVAVCLEHGVIVTSAVPGDHMHTQLYRNMLPLHFQRNHWILEAYRALGSVLAAFHTNAEVTMPSTTRITAFKELEEVGNLLPDDAGCKRLREFLADKEVNRSELGLIHGNLRRENIILTPDRRIGLIDFEDSGLGSRYDDLSKICSAMLLTKTAKLFPWRPVYRALNSMLSGYNQRSPICEITLTKYMALRVATQYALSFTGKCQTIARIPISQRKTRRLLDALLLANERNSLTLIDRSLSIGS